MFQFLFRAMLVLAAFGGMAFLGYGLRLAIAPEGQEATGAELRVICQECGNVEVAKVRQIRACFCSKCGNPVGEAWRCLDCKKVFAFVMRMPKNRGAGRKGLEDWAAMHRCPRCQSPRTKPVPVEEGDQSGSTQGTADVREPAKKTEANRP